MIKDWIDSYKTQTIEQTEQAIREIMQEITLAGLNRSDFFNQAAFYGGTALRIFHGLDRFSEDLDFSLLEKNTAFDLEQYFPAIQEEFISHGIQVDIAKKIKTTTSAIDSAFLRSDSIWGELIIQGIVPQQINTTIKSQIKIKIEIDTHPPLKFTTENLLLLRPYSFYVRCLSLPDLFAGKMHALLYRKWKNRVKGRDWYDMEWYIRKGIKLNLIHFSQRAKESSDWFGDNLTHQDLIELLENKIETVNFEQIKLDIIRFIPHPEQLNIWGKDYFLQLIKLLKTE